MVKTITPRNIYAFLYAIFTLKNIWVVLCVNFENRHTFIFVSFFCLLRKPLSQLFFFAFQFDFLRHFAAIYF